MTLLNNTRAIEELAGQVVYHVDAKEFEKAHCALDDIEKKVHETRRHVEHLQNVGWFAVRPAGGE
ncbi:hypothetical protein ES705_49478 [subsurface metagenome]